MAGTRRHLYRVAACEREAGLSPASHVYQARVRLAGGLDIEIGFARLSWASTAPVEPGTAQAVPAGCRVVTDPDSRLVHLVEVVSATRAG